MALTDYMNLYFDWVAFGTLALAPMVFALLFFIRAPYGRHIRTGWGPLIENRLGWVIMESVAVLVFGGILLCYAEMNAAAWVFFIIWQVHYFHRAFVYPLTLSKGRKMPWLIMLMAVLFNTANGYLNGWSIASQPEKYVDQWLTTPQFLVGISIFIAGMILNKVSDQQLSRLRKSGSGEGKYQVPYGYAYRWVSCPNYLGEIIQWIGWAIATWSLAGLVFAVWTMANLVPRAIAHHRWYRENFKDYPADRRALIPFII